MTLLLALSFLAQAQVTNGDTPEINAQAWRPSVDSKKFLWMTDSAMLEDGFSGRAMLAYANRPLTYKPFGYPDEADEVVLLGHLTELDLVGAFTRGPVRIGLVAPLYLRGSGDTGGGTGLGDLVLDGKAQLLDRQRAPIGAALSLRATLPTATLDLPVGSNGVLYELEGSVDKAFGNTLLALNLGHRGQPDVALENGTFGDQFYSRLGAAQTLGDRSGIGAEWITSLNYSNLDDAAGLPSELMFEGWQGLRDSDLVLRGGIGVGLGTAVAIPAARAVLTLSWEPGPDENDLDGDGIVDADDSCPDRPEDADGTKDTDGCPDIGTVRFEFVDQFGDPIEGGEWSVGRRSGDHDQPIDLDAGDYEAVASAPGAEEATVSFSAPEEGEEVVKVVLQVTLGSLVVKAETADGEPIDGASWVLVDDADERTPADEARELKPGEYAIRAEAEGFRAVKKTVTVKAESEETVVFQLEPAKVEIGKDRIDIEGSVYFETAKAIIRTDSYDLLDEVAEILSAHPELQKVRIEGHTDSDGGTEYNKELSHDRARAVRDYLVKKGVESDRLEYEGFGESKPLVEEKTAADKQKNRRVDFVVVERAD